MTRFALGLACALALALTTAPSAGAFVFWANKYEGAIGRADDDAGGADQAFIHGLPPMSHPVGLAVRGAHLYWSNFQDGDSIGRVNLDVSLVLGYQPPPAHVSDQVIVGNPLNPEDGWEHEDIGRTHLRLFTARALGELCEHHGLQVLSLDTNGYYPLPPRLARLATRVDQRHGAFLVGVFRRVPRRRFLRPVRD